MRDHRFKTIGIALIALFIAAAAFAAGGTESSATEDATTVRWFGIRGVPAQDAPIPLLIEDLLSERLGYEVKFDFSGVADDNLVPVLNLRLAAGDLPDVFIYWGVNDSFTQQAVTRFQLEEMFTNMPMMTAYMREKLAELGADDSEIWPNYQDQNGLMFGVPRIGDMSAVPRGQVWRQDLLDALGHDVPRTLAQAETVFADFKAAYPNMFPIGASGTVNWQAFDIVFNAFGLVSGGHGVVDGTIRQHFAYPEYRAALEVLARWYSLGYIDPEWITHDVQAKIRAFAQGRYLAVEWIDYTEWNLTADSPLLGSLLTNVPGAGIVAAPHLRATAETTPAQRIWNPFLNQIMGFGKHLENDREHMHRVMQVADLISQDPQIKYLATWGVEGEHYVIDPVQQVPTRIDSLVGRSAADLSEQFGFGVFLGGLFPTRTVLSDARRQTIESFVRDPSGIYHPNNLNYWVSMLTGPVLDDDGEDIGAYLAADPALDHWVMSTKIITGQEPISYYDSWLANWYRLGGTDWERHATRLYLD